MKIIFYLLLLTAGFVNGQIVNIPNANFKAKLIALGIDTNNDGQIQNVEALAVTELDVSNSNISSLTGILSFLNLTNLTCSNNQIATLNVSNLNNLSQLRCNNNFITALNVGGTNLYRLDCSYNQLSSLNFSGLTSVLYIDCNNNNLTSINLGTLPYLDGLNCSNNQLTSLNLTSLAYISYYFVCSYNLLTTLTAPLTGAVYCENNQLTSLILHPNNAEVNCANNLLTSLDFSNRSNGFSLDCSNNQLTNLNLSGSTIAKVNCSNNFLNALDLTNVMIDWNDPTSGFDCSFNQISEFTFDNTKIDRFKCNNNLLSMLDLSNIIITKEFNCSNNQLTNINFGDNSKMPTVNVSNNLLTSIDITNCFFITGLNCSNNLLTTIFAKNGRNEFIDFTNNPDLFFICADDEQISSLASVALSTTAINSYCNFFPGGRYNTIAGISRFDSDNNGCNDQDLGFSNLRINITDGFDNGTTFTNGSGDYKIYTQSLDYTLTPALEHPTYFNVSPTSSTINFSENAYQTQIQDFCVTANGVHNDLEVVVYPVGQAQSGTESAYILVYKNKGNQLVSGSINLDFNQELTDFLAAIPPVDSQTSNTLTWNYSNLLPFESRTINFSVNVNSSTVEPAVDDGDQLMFSATINPVEGDGTPLDNVFVYNQTVVNSYIPNDITCLEGSNLPPSQIGNYLHYCIQFENTGSNPAENVVLRQVIDPTKFDLSTLQVLHSSSQVRTVITNAVVEFIFEGINLEAAGTPPVGGHGTVLFKVKTKNNLATNTTVAQQSDIYFGYNFPVVTNLAATTFSVLNNTVFEKEQIVKIFPNPTTAIINIVSIDKMQSVELYDVQGRVLVSILENDTNCQLDISGKSNGIYFLKIKTESGIKISKIVKQ